MNQKKVTTARGAAAVTNRHRVNPRQQERLPASTASAGVGVVPDAASEGDDYAGLVRAAAAGNAEALNRLLLRAQEVAWRFSTSVCGHADDAEDAMQEALIKTYRYVGQIRDPAAFRPWLYRTVRNACLIARRKRKGEPARLRSLDDVWVAQDGEMQLDAPDPAKDPEQLADNAALRRRLREALRRLPAAYRAVVFLREMEGLSTREVATVMGISEDNVKARLHRARVQLQADLVRDVP